MRLTDVIFKALAPALPDGRAGRDQGDDLSRRLRRRRPGDRRLLLLPGDAGRRVRRPRQASDGPDAVQVHGQNTENAPIEETEANYPVRILRYELVEDSEGAGRRRGGLGLRRDYTFPDHEVTFTVLADRDRAGPWGLFGGEPGRRAEYLLHPRRRGAPARLEDDDRAGAGRRRQLPHLRRRRLRPTPRARAGARPARRARGQGQPRRERETPTASRSIPRPGRWTRTRPQGYGARLSSRR